MPSGAKKRKAAKKKLHNNPPHHHNHASYSQGTDGGDVGRESAEEVAVKSYEGESNFAETAKEVNPVESHNGDASEEHKSSSGSSSSDDDEVDVEKDKSVVGEVGDEVVKSEEEIDVQNYDGESNFVETAEEVKPAESHNGDATEKHKSSTGSSSSDGDEVDVEKDKSVVGEVGDEKVKSDDFVPDGGLGENGAGVEVVEETVNESIPVEETVKEVVLNDPVNDSVPAESSSVPDVVDTKLNSSLNEVSPPSGMKENVAYEVTDLGLEKSEGKEVPVVDNGLGNSSISADNSARDVEAKSGGDDRVKESGKVKTSEEQPLISSTPLPVRRTSWMNCCGLFEVISGGSSR